jgi:hypothetical protein
MFEEFLIIEIRGHFTRGRAHGTLSGKKINFDQIVLIYKKAA